MIFAGAGSIFGSADKVVDRGVEHVGDSDQHIEGALALARLPVGNSPDRDVQFFGEFNPCEVLFAAEFPQP